MVKLEIKNLDKLITAMEKTPAIAEEYVGKAISRSLIRVLTEEKKAAPFGVSGNLRDNWNINVGRFEGRLTSMSPYAAAVNYGTGPHHVSPTQLAPWAAKKGLNPFAVAKSIAKKGTRANPFFDKAVANAEDGVNKEFETAGADIIKALSF